jgi:hypothetical protein
MCFHISRQEQLILGAWYDHTAYAHGKVESCLMTWSRTRRLTEGHLEALASIESYCWVILTTASSGEDNVSYLVRRATYDVWDILEQYYQWATVKLARTNCDS